MRITLGGILLGAGLGASAVYFVMDPSRSAVIQKKLSETSPGLMRMLGAYKPAEETPKEQAYNPPPPFPVGATDSNGQGASVAGSSATAGAVPSSMPMDQAAPVSAQVEAAPTPLPTLVPVDKSGWVSATTRRRGRRKKSVAAVKAGSAIAAAETVAVQTPAKKRGVRKKALTTKARTTVKKSVPVKTAVAPAPKNDLTGTYVSLELVTGRSVQGILQGKTATHYVLNVPGLGPLEYPIDNVKSVQPAQ